MKKNLLLVIVLAPFSFLLAQKGVFEIGLNTGMNISSAVNFKENSHHWDVKPIKTIQSGATFGHRFNDFYSFRLGVNLEQRGFKDSTYIDGHSHTYTGVDEYLSSYISFPFLNEFHFFNHHLIAIAGLDYSYSIWKYGTKDINDWGIIGGIGTRFDLNRKLKWHLDAKFNRSLKAWRYRYDIFYFDGFKTFNISTGLIYAFEKKKK